MRLKGLIDDTKYEEKSKELKKEEQETESMTANTCESNLDRKIKVEDSLEFAYACAKKFETGSRNAKHEVLLRVSENLLLKSNKLLEITLKREYEVTDNEDNWSERYKNWREPKKYTEIMDKNPNLRPKNPSWLPL